MQSSNTIQFHQIEDNTILEIENAAATARISLFGGHVLSFTPKHDNTDRLWMSPLTQLNGSEAIRGGVPVCWPWFSNQFPASYNPPSDTTLPSHGYARTSFWQLAAINCPTPDITEITLNLTIAEKPGFPYHGTLVYRITVAKELTLTLETKNTDQQAFAITSALHTYFRVGNVEDVEVLGLTGKYKDKTQGFAEFDTPALYKVNGEVDRVHLTQEPAITIRESQQNIFIEMQGHDSTVVWNPGREGVTKISNVPDNAFTQFLCVEAAVTSATTIAPQDSHILIQKMQ